MITLAIDASTYCGDVALLDGSTVLAEASVAMKGADQERLMPAVADVMGQAGVRVSNIRRVVCGAGPGSFTSLRIAGAIAKGIARGGGCELFAVPSMALILGGTRLGHGRYLVAVDALRGEFYAGVYAIESDGSIVEMHQARLIAVSGIDSMAAGHAATIVSPSARSSAVVSLPRARSVARLERTLQMAGPVSLVDWEPAYGRLAEAQVRWESVHGSPLPAG
jgi:tRNA threonylcarbamoyladenosine biosynthesis protein TsaB